MKIFSIGHSTREIHDFLNILEKYEIRALVDIRTIPRSRRNPQFNDDALSTSLKEHAINYEKLASLGGLRKPKPDSMNLGWRNESFRGYADHMQSPDFEGGLNQLISIGQKEQTVMMCAEAVPWKCHRSLVGDALLIRGIEVMDIFDLLHAKPHTLTKFAKVDGLRLTYPGEQAQLTKLD